MDYCLSIVFISVLAYSPSCELSEKMLPTALYITAKNRYDKTKMMV